MSTLAVAAILIALLFVLLAGGLWIAMAMSVVGWFGRVTPRLTGFRGDCLIGLTAFHS